MAEAVERALQSGKTVVYPYCTGRTSMEALQPEDDGAWQTDRNGMRAPIPSRSRRVDPEDIDLVLVPCTAFDGDGNRVGMGRRLLRPVPAALPARANDARGL